MVSSAILPLSLLDCIFFEILYQPFPQKQVNMRNTESLSSRLTSHPALDPCPVKLSYGGIMMYFDKPYKIKDLTKSNNFCGKVYYFSEK